MFTNKQINEIIEKISKIGIKDTDLENASELNGSEVISIVQNNVQKKATLSDVFNYDEIEYVKSAIKNAFDIDDDDVITNQLNIGMYDDDTKIGISINVNGSNKILGTIGIGNFISALSNNSTTSAPTQKSVNDALSLKANTSTVNEQLGHKVDKISGKGLSTNDYTNADKSKVSQIQNKLDKPSVQGTEGQVLSLNEDLEPIWKDEESVPDGVVRYDIDQDLRDTEKSTAQHNIGVADDINSLKADVYDINQVIPSSAASNNKLTDKAYVDVIGGRVSTIENKIPAQASQSNQLADKAFVNSSVQTATANFRGAWEDWESVPVDSHDYPQDYAGHTAPTTNDYLVVQNAELYGFSTNIERSWTVGEICVGRIEGDDPAMYYCVYEFDGRAVDSPNSFQMVFYLSDYVGNFFDAEEWYEGNICSYNDQFYECTADVDTTFENTPDKDTEHWDFISMNYNNIRFGTWRFKYSGLWSEMNKNGWLPEYQVNETPLTAAQLAALNSGITAEIVAKAIGALQDVKVDGVSVVSGGVANIQKEVFVAEYGVSTFAEVKAAYDAGKFVIAMTNSGELYILSASDSTQNTLTNANGSGNRYLLFSNNNWVFSTSSANEKSSNKVTSLSAASTDTQYPSAKAVYDYAKPNEFQLVATITTQEGGSNIVQLLASCEGYTEFLVDRRCDTAISTGVYLRIGNTSVGFLSLNSTRRAVFRVKIDGAVTICDESTYNYAYDGRLNSKEVYTQYNAITPSNALNLHYYELAEAPAGETIYVYAK